MRESRRTQEVRQFLQTNKFALGPYFLQQLFLTSNNLIYLVMRQVQFFGGKTKNIAIQVVLQQCCTFYCPFYRSLRVAPPFPRRFPLLGEGWGYTCASFTVPLCRRQTLTLVFPDPVGPTNISPCLTTVVSYNWIHLVTNPSTSSSPSFRQVLRMESSRSP